jgi:heme oxygenase
VSRSVWERIEESRAREAISPEEADTVVAAAESAFLANWRLLDGVS